MTKQSNRIRKPGHSFTATEVISIRAGYFQTKLQKQGMDQSMSRVGHCIANGPTEGL